jgi:ABC-type sugar transport system ATPase subunit
VLEQVGTPEELYERPANRFVGGFIGSPAMSFFDAAAVAEAGGVRLRAEGVELRVGDAPELPANVTVGVRPEAARVWNGDGAIGPLQGTVAFVEALGRETFIGVDAVGSRLTLFHEGRSRLQPGDAVEFGLEPRALRYFGPDGRLV